MKNKELLQQLNNAYWEKYASAAEADIDYRCRLIRKNIEAISDTAETACKNNPFLSIVTINFNEDMIEETCLSIINQTYDNVEWIVVDGGSTSEYKAILEKYVPFTTKYISEKDGGIYNAMNKGIAMANGEWITFMNGGDIYYSFDALRNAISKIPSGTDAVYGDEMRFKSKKKASEAIVRFPEKISRTHLCYSFIPHQSTLYKKELFEKNGLYDESYIIVADTERNMCFMNAGAKYCKVDTVIAVHNQEGLSSQSKFDGVREGEKIRCRRVYYTDEELRTYKAPYNVYYALKGLIKMENYGNGRFIKYYLFGKIPFMISKGYY